MQSDNDLVRAVHEHWILTGVDVHHANDMADELVDHLNAAAADGKDVKAVVGPDLRRFADEWAAPLTQPVPARRRIALVILSATMFANANVATDALVGWQSTVQVDPIMTGLFALVGGLFATVLVGPRLSRVQSRGLRSNLQIAVFVGLVVGLLFGTVIWVTSAFDDVLTVTLPTWIVLGLTVVTFVVTVGPLMLLFAKVEQTDGWTRRIIHTLGRFF